jgi:hypothetical protein
MEVRKWKQYRRGVCRIFTTLSALQPYFTTQALPWLSTAANRLGTDWDRRPRERGGAQNTHSVLSRVRGERDASHRTKTPRMSASARSPQVRRTCSCAERFLAHDLYHDTSTPKIKSRGNRHHTSLDASPVASSEPLPAPSPSTSCWGPGDAALVKRRARHMSRAERLRERFFGGLFKNQSSMAVTEEARDAVAAPNQHRARDTGAVAKVGHSVRSQSSSPSRPAPTRRDWGHGDSLYEPGDAVLVERRTGHTTLSERRARRLLGKPQSSTVPTFPSDWLTYGARTGQSARGRENRFGRTVDGA